MNRGDRKTVESSPDSGPLIIGHRGASAHAPENTHAAFELAFADGADGIEFDVRLASDGVPFVFHDATFERTVGIYGNADDYPSTMLEQVYAGAWFNERYPRRARIAYEWGEKIPTLAQVFERYGSHLLYAEMKCEDVSAPAGAGARRRRADSQARPRESRHRQELRARLAPRGQAARARGPHRGPLRPQLAAPARARLQNHRRGRGVRRGRNLAPPLAPARRDGRGGAPPRLQSPRLDGQLAGLPAPRAEAEPARRLHRLPRADAPITHESSARRPRRAAKQA